MIEYNLSNSSNLLKESQCQYLKIVLGHLKSKFISQNYKETYMTLYQTEYKVLTFHLKDYFEDKHIQRARRVLLLLI